MANTLRLPTDLAPISGQLAINAVIGSGAAFPFSFGGSGGVSAVSISTGLAKINQSIHMILSTRKGERVMRPTFGSDVDKLLFDPNDPPTWNRLKYEIADSLIAWEQRIQITTITAIVGASLAVGALQTIPGITQQIITNLQSPNAMGIIIQYIVLRYNVPGSYVYPFSLNGEPLNSNLDLRFN